MFSLNINFKIILQLLYSSSNRVFFSLSLYNELVFLDISMKNPALKDSLMLLFS